MANIGWWVAATGLALAGTGGPGDRGILDARPVPWSRGPAVRVDSVRQLRVAIVLLTSSFNKTLTPAEIERVHEEVAEFYAFYQQHGAGKVDFDFSLVEIDRRLARREIAEVSPNRYYLSRENLEAELAARGFRGRFDEVIALHAWSNANPDRALQAYGGGAVGPDGLFLGDAGFNSIPVMGRDPDTIGQVLIHEVLHNLDDMFSRSGMADSFLNSDEMSRNMPRLLRERPGAFQPRHGDAEMLAYAERERQGREAYPWALQLVYYGWMLERTPKVAWDGLRYGRLVPRDAELLRPLYGAVYTSAANPRVYVPVLGGAPGVITADAVRLTPRTWTQADFDGTAILSGRFLGGWVPLRGAGDTAVVAIINSGGVAAGARVVVVRQRVASVVVEPEIVRYLEEAPRPLDATVRLDRCCGLGPELAGAVMSVDGDTTHHAPRTTNLTFTATAPLTYIHPGVSRLTVRRSWQVADDGPLTVAAGAPVTLNASVREDRGRPDVAARATLHGRTIPLESLGDGRYTATLTDELPFGLHWARLEARAPDGTAVMDSLRVYVRPAGWIRVPETYIRNPDGRLTVHAAVQGRMGVDLTQALPLVAIAGDRVTPLAWDSAARRYEAVVYAAEPVRRIVVTSIVGDIQRRVVGIVDRRVADGRSGGRADSTNRAGFSPPDRQTASPPVRRSASPPFASAVRLDTAPAIDADLADWPATTAAPITLGAANHLLTDTARYRGDADLSAVVRFAWDDSTLYVGGTVTDDSVTAGEAWDTDRVNLVFDMKDDTTPLSYATANPPLDQWQDDDYWVFWRSGGQAVRRFGKANADPVPGARIATRRTAGGWVFEVAIPRDALPGYVPFPGQVAGMQLFITDGDGEASATELMWTARWPYSADGIEWRLAELAHLLFVDAPVP